jgi:uncharacterized repeat protein (TIGR03837 family)
MKTTPTCDIFCAVVDNYGDIGVCWRLARQLAGEHDCTVRLWVDDLASFARLCPEADATLARQSCQGVEVRCWDESSFAEVTPAQFVIETFACKLPLDYMAAMAQQAPPPVWVNLEYLSAEDWVENCHALPSPQSLSSLVRYFFFPGFTEKTGGLLLERGLLSRRDVLQRGNQNDVRVSLFCYETPALPALLHAWTQSPEPIHCLMPEGIALSQAAAFFGQTHAAVGDVFRRGNLTLEVLPFTDQNRYDELLCSCDINFVRGEDSFVRAQWAAQPFVWHIYPQHDGVHLHKLRAFMARYCVGLPPATTRAFTAMWEVWNGEKGDISAVWHNFMAHRAELRQHGLIWAQQQSRNNLALNLLNFYQKIDRMRASQN